MEIPRVTSPAIAALRDQFATAALRGLIASCDMDEKANVHGYKDAAPLRAVIARAAYGWADAMLEARAAEPGQEG